MNISTDSYGNLIFILVPITTLILIFLGEFKREPSCIVKNFFINLFQPFGVIYFLYRLHLISKRNKEIKK